MTTVAGDFAVITVIGITVVARMCMTRCHAKIELPFPLPAKGLWQAWDDAEAEGWHVLDKDPEIGSDSQVQQFAREGITTTFEECEAR